MHHNSPRLSSSTRRLVVVVQALLVLNLLFVGLAPEVFPQARQTRRAQRTSVKSRALSAGIRRTRRTARLVGQVGRLLSFQTPKLDEDSELEMQENRLDWFTLQRSYPHPFFNLPPLARSFELKRQLFKASRLGLGRNSLAILADAQSQWKAIGSPPIESSGRFMRPTTGRITAVAISPADPKLILIGAATGGIWRSTDEGRNFVPVTDDQTELAVRSIAFSKSDPSIVYAGMGDATAGYLGTGVLKSTDGGRCWIKIGSPSLPLATISKIIVNPFNPDSVYLAEYRFRDPRIGGSAENGGFHFSTDGGSTWSKETQRGVPRDLVIHPTDPNTLYLALADSPTPDGFVAAVFKSIDGGRTWQRILTPADGENPALKFNFKIGVSPAAPENVYVLATHQRPDGTPPGELFFSANGGKDWTSRSLGASDIVDVGVWFLAVDPSEAKTLYVGTGDLFKSADGGASWKNLTKNWSIVNNKPAFSAQVAHSHTDQRAFSFSPSDPQTIYVGNDGGIYRSNCGGESTCGRPFNPLNDTLPVLQLTSITAHPKDADTIYAGTQDNGALIFRKGAPGWSEFSTGDSGGSVLDSNDPSIAYVSVYYGIIDRFVNADFATKKPVSNNLTFGESTRPPRIAFFPPFISDPSTGKLYFGSSRLFFSANKGQSWQESTPGMDLTKGESTTFGSDVLSVIGLSPSQRGVIYTGSAHGRVMTTRDDGKTWTDITGTLPNRFIKSIVVDAEDPQTAYLTVSGFGTGHVFKTSDGGTNWTDISGDLSNVPVNALIVDPTDKNILYIGTDIGVFRSTVNGGIWEPLNSGLPPVIVTDFSVRADKTILIATYGRGAYEFVK